MQQLPSLTETEYTVYLITCALNSKVYVGQTRKTLAERLKQHISESNRGSMYALHKAMRDHGVQNFTIQPIETFKTSDARFADQMEQKYITHYNSGSPAVGYNTHNAYTTLEEAADQKKRVRDYNRMYKCYACPLAACNFAGRDRNGLLIHQNSIKHRANEIVQQMNTLCVK